MFTQNGNGSLAFDGLVMPIALGTKKAVLVIGWGADVACFPVEDGVENFLLAPVWAGRGIQSTDDPRCFQKLVLGNSQLGRSLV